MANITGLKISYDKNNIILFDVVINGKSKECIGRRYESVKNDDGTGKVYCIKFITTGVRISMAYFWSGSLIEDIILDLLNSGLTEWNYTKTKI